MTRCQISNCADLSSLRERNTTFSLSKRRNEKRKYEFFLVSRVPYAECYNDNI